MRFLDKEHQRLQSGGRARCRPLTRRSDALSSRARRVLDSRRRFSHGGHMIDAPIDHVAIVVKDLDAAIRLYTETLGFSLVYREIVADQGIEAVGVRTGDAVIELLRPLSEDSTIAKFRRDAATK